MNKFGPFSFGLLLSITTITHASESYYHRYGTTVNTPPVAPSNQVAAPIQPRNQPEMIANNATQRQPAPQIIVQQQVIEQTPPAAHYGFYGQKSIQGSGQRFIVGGNPYVPPSDQINQNAYYNSPVFKEEVKNKKTQNKLYYVGIRGGIGGTFGWDNGQHKPVKPIFGLVAGTWATPDIRLDAELDYHLKGKLSNNSTRQTTYKQYDLGANIYYDFPKIEHGLIPFVGGGLWLVNKKITDKPIVGKTVSNSSWRWGFSANAGLTYPISEAFSLSAMLRGRYLITSESLYNLEALFGAQYAF